MKFVLFFLFGILSFVSTFKFEDAHETGVEFGDQGATGQIISVDESNDGSRVNIVSVTEVEGQLTVTVPEYEDIMEIAVEMGLNIGQWYITMNRLDYESLVESGIGDNFIIDVTDDNDPSITQSLDVFILDVPDDTQ